MATFFPFHCLTEDLAHGIHNFASHQLTVALVAAANPPSQSTHDQLSDLTQISYTNFSSRNITTTSSAQTGGTYKLTLTDLALTATGAVATFRYVVIYNNGAVNDELIGFYDFGSNVTIGDQPFTIDFDATNGLFNIALA